MGSSSPPSPSPPLFAAKFFGAVLLILIGICASLVGSWEWQRTMDPRALHAENHAGALMATIAGIIAFGLGCMLAAAENKVEGKALQNMLVLFIMTPLPSAIAMAFNRAGHYLWLLANSTAQSIVAGIGFFLLALGGMSLWQDFPPGNPTSFRDVLWTLFLDLGLALLLLAAVPAFSKAPEMASVRVDEEGTEAPPDGNP